MKKRLFGLALILCMVLALLPAMHAGAASAQMPWEAEPDKWTALTASSTALAGGNYYLTSNVTATDTIAINGTVTIDLNGYVLTLNNDAKQNIIKVESGTLTIQDSNSGKLTHKFNVSSGRWDLDETNGSTTVTGGVIYGNIHTMGDEGEAFLSVNAFVKRGVYVCVGANLVLNSGNIIGCLARYNSSQVYYSDYTEPGGGVYVQDGNSKKSGSFTMNGGGIYGCQSLSSNGGGVYIGFYGTFTMNGGAIENCKGAWGGGVFAGKYTSFTMTDGTIEACHARSGGCLVSGNQNTVFNMIGGTIGTCANSGCTNSGIDVSDADMTMYAYGGIVKASVKVNQGQNYQGVGGKITTDTSSPYYKPGQSTVFNGAVTNKATIGAGIYYGGLTHDGGKIKDGAHTITFKNGENEYAILVLDDKVTSFAPIEPTADRVGYVLSGWYEKDANGFKSTPFAFDSAVNKDLILYSQFVPSTYTVTYNAGANGTGMVTAGSKIYDVDFTLSSDTFTRTGYTQTGWATSDGGAKVYDLGGKYTANANVTLYPVWTINQYTITVKPDNGGDDITIKQNYGTTVTAPTLAKTGYKFDGWDKTFPTTMPAKDMTITAMWTIKQYTITVKPDNGGDDIIITQNYGTTVTAPTLTKTGYKFDGWDKTFPATMPAGDMTITAMWTINQYTITVKPDNGGDDITIKQNYGTTVTAPTLTKTGYKFDGWDKTFPTTMPAEDMTITAKWVDDVAPTVSGIENGKTYCSAVSFTASDNVGVTSVKLNGQDLQAANGVYTVAPAAGEQTITVADAAGNKTEIKITVNSDHTWQNGKCIHCTIDCKHPTTVTVGYKPDNHIKQWAGESGVTSCTACGKVLRENTKIAPSAHRGGKDYASNDTEHWKTCTYYGCDAEVKNTREAHTLDDSGVCTTCGYKKNDYLRGDFDDNDIVNSDDAIYLLRHVFFGDQYPANQPADLNKDGKVTSDDAIYLLRHVFFPETYPLV